MGAVRVQGVIHRNLRDVLLATQAMAQGDARAPWRRPAPFDGPTIEPAPPESVAGMMPLSDAIWRVVRLMV